MKVITLLEPWASFILWGWKKIETRTHDRFRNLNGQRIAIHAALTFDNVSDYSAYLDVNQKRFLKGIFETGYFGESRGKILCTVQVYDYKLLWNLHSQPALIDCERTKRYGLFLRNITKIQNPIPTKGHQGIFSVPDSWFNINMAVERNGQGILNI